jgi:Fe-S-cluster containining protein
MRYPQSVKPTDLPHDSDEDGDHDPDACYPCLAATEVQSVCRCAEWCRRLILEVLPEDAEVEPRIKRECSPIYDGLPLTKERELIGYLLNGDDGPCVFLDKQQKLCTIHPTRPLMCRLFDWDGEDRNELVQLGILPPRK